MKDLFLCHSGRDDEWVEALGARLEAETSNGRPLEVFVDRWDIDYGENILTRIEEGLRDARFLGVVMSPAWAAADWARLEWQSKVHEDPAGRKGRILPILLHKEDPETREPLEIPLPLKLLRWFDFSDPRRYEAEYQELLRRIRGEPPRRGGPGAPDRTGPDGWPGREMPSGGEEALISNLLEVHRYPARIWSDHTTARQKSDVWNAHRGKTVPPFVLHAGRLYSFFSPDHAQNPFTRFLTGTDPRSEATVSWLRDPDASRRLIGLFNEALKEHCFHLGIRRPKRAGTSEGSRDRAQYFCPIYDDQPRLFRWREGARPRVLSKVVQGPKDTVLGVHYAADLRFLTLGQEVYLAVEPGWFFTTDGSTPLQGKQVSVFSTKWGGRERNAAVLRNLMMWSILLAAGGERITINVGGDETLDVLRIPAHARTPAGIEGDVIPLEGILGGAGAGESAAESGTEPEDELEFDKMALIRLAGALAEDNLDSATDDDLGSESSSNDGGFLF